MVIGEDFQCSETEYAERIAAKAFSPYALVHDDQWYQYGEMGWFGISSDEIPEHEWNKTVNDIIDSLPDDTLISFFDCHI